MDDTTCSRTQYCHLHERHHGNSVASIPAGVCCYIVTRQPMRIWSNFRNIFYRWRWPPLTLWLIRRALRDCASCVENLRICSVPTAESLTIGKRIRTPPTSVHDHFGPMTDMSRAKCHDLLSAEFSPETGFVCYIHKWHRQLCQL